MIVNVSQNRLLSPRKPKAPDLHRLPDGGSEARGAGHGTWRAGLFLHLGRVCFEGLRVWGGGGS